MRELGSPIQEVLLEFRLSRDQWESRGDPCGLLLGLDEHAGYQCEPPQFRPFCSWGVDGVYDGLWIDEPTQTHAPFFVLLSPMDFGEPVQLLASSTIDWLAIVADEFTSTEIASAARDRALERRQSLGLTPIGATDST